MGNDANTVGKEVKYAAAGAVVGGTVGSVVPVVGTAVGAVAGAAVGSLVGLFSGGPEAQQQSANLGGRSIDAYTIYQKINAGDPTSLNTGVASAQTLQKIHDARITEIDNLNTKMDAAWQGGGATAAQAGAHPLGLWLQDSVNNLGKSHTYLNTQVDCFGTVKSKVQNIPKDPPSAGFLDGVNPFSDKDDEINDYNNNAKANVDAYTAYFTASGSNASSLPQYSAWQGNNLSGNPGGPNLPGGPGGGKIPSMSGGPGGGGTSSFKPGDMPKFDAKPPSTDLTGNHTGVNDPNNPNNTGIPTGTYNPTGSDSTTAQGFTPSSFDSSGFGPGGAGGFGPGGGAGSFGAGGGSGFGGGGAGSGAVAGFGPGAFGAGAGFGPGGAASGAAEGLGGAGGARGGAMGGAMGAAGKAGTSGMGGMGAGGAKGGKGTEDEEHQTKYLVEEDANELFGTDELTAPPVIGE